MQTLEDRGDGPPIRRSKEQKDEIATMTETHKTDLAASEVDAEDGKAYRQARIDEAN